MMRKVDSTYLLLDIFQKNLPNASCTAVIGTDEGDFQYIYDEEAFTFLHLYILPPTHSLLIEAVYTDFRSKLLKIR